MEDEKFLREFKEVYDAINLIGKEVFKISAEITALAAEVNSIRNHLAGLRNEQSREQRAAVAPESPHIRPPEPTLRELHEAPGQAPTDATRSRTGSFKPGDQQIDVSNVFYYGNKKK